MRPAAIENRDHFWTPRSFMEPSDTFWITSHSKFLAAPWLAAGTQLRGECGPIVFRGSEAIQPRAGSDMTPCGGWKLTPRGLEKRPRGGRPIEIFWVIFRPRFLGHFPTPQFKLKIGGSETDPENGVRN